MVFLVLNGCAGSQEASVYGPWTSHSEERGDTLIVRTLSGSIWGDTMTLVPDLAIGAFEEPPDLVFGRVSGLELDAQGRLLVIDAQAREVRIFSSTGEHWRTFGGTGDGPGELRGPDHLRATTDDRIVVRDQSAGRFAVFSGEGEYLGGWLRGSGFASGAPFFLDENEHVVNPTLIDRLVAYDLDGVALDTIPVPTRGFTPPALTVASGPGIASYSIPFMPAEVWTMTRDGRVVFGLTSEYSFERWGTDRAVLRIERSVEPVPVSSAETAQVREEVTRAIRRANANWRWDGPDIPSVKPAFDAIRAGVDGTIWVFRQGRSIEDQNPYWDPDQPEVSRTRWRATIVADVFDEHGRYLGPVLMPESINWSHPAAILSADWVWATTTHNAGYPQVVRLRVAPR